MNVLIYLYSRVIFKNGNIAHQEQNKILVNGLYANGGTNMMSGNLLLDFLFLLHEVFVCCIMVLIV